MKTNESGFQLEDILEVLDRRKLWIALAALAGLLVGAVIYLALVMTALGYGLWYRLLGHYSVNQVMPFLLLLPVTSVFGGIFFLGESLTIKIALGGGLAIIGVAMITIQRSSFFRQVQNDQDNL